ELVQAGANDIQGISFGVKDNQKLMDEARKLAIADARRKAELYAAEAGVRLGKVVRISEVQVQFPEFQRLSKDELAPGVPFATGEQPLSCSVSVTYELVEMPIGCDPGIEAPPSRA